MDIIQIGAIGIIAVILIVAIKKEAPQISLIISIVTGAIIFIIIVPKLSAVLDMITKLTENINIDLKYISVIIKIIGVAYISQFCSQICIDAGESSIASKIELAGKVLIMVISMPVLLGLVDLIMTMMP